MSLKWYFRYKWHVMRHESRYVFHSPKTFMFVYLALSGYGVLYWAQTGRLDVLMFVFPFFVVYWIYLDYLRGVPNKWKYQKIVEDDRKRKQKEELDNAGKNS